MTANTNIEVCLVDYDNLENGDRLFSVFSPDFIFEDGMAHERFIDQSDPIEMEVRDDLKRIKF